MQGRRGGSGDVIDRIYTPVLVKLQQCESPGALDADEHQERSPKADGSCEIRNRQGNENSLIPRRRIIDVADIPCEGSWGRTRRTSRLHRPEPRPLTATIAQQAIERQCRRQEKLTHGEQT